jgi:deoxyribonuclease-4
MIRVRQLIEALSACERRSLLRLIAMAPPPEALVPARYPAALLTALGGAVCPSNEAFAHLKYCLLGVIAEEALKRPKITPATIVQVLEQVLAGENAALAADAVAAAASAARVLRSKTTADFAARLTATRAAMVAVAQGPLRYDTVVRMDVRGGALEGHPDAVAPAQIFEVKLTGQVQKNWDAFLLQLYSYDVLSGDRLSGDVLSGDRLSGDVLSGDRLSGDVLSGDRLDVKIEERLSNTLFIVLPMQAVVVRCAPWPVGARAKWRAILAATAAARLAPPEMPAAQQAALNAGAVIRYEFGIGSHVARLPSLAETIRGLPRGRPAQIFLGSPRGGALRISDAEVAAAAAAVASTSARLYVHAPYTINLCRNGSVDCLLQQLQVAAAIGCRGVVVHVGKAVGLPDAMANMRANVLAAAAGATGECPLLIETPAGQGTETLTDRDEFLAFVASVSLGAPVGNQVGAPVVAICVDTCHVFACGHDPADFVARARATNLLRLVHFNDSAGACGSRVDRHAAIGAGLIGADRMRELAVLSTGIDMIVE